MAKVTKALARMEFDEFSPQTIQNAAEADLANTSTVKLEFKWTPNSKLIFYVLHYRLKDGEWQDALKGVSVKDNDGYAEFYLGSFSHGADIEVRFSVFAMTAVPKAFAVITQTNPIYSQQASPRGTIIPKKIDSGDKWEDQFKYTIKA
jgi:hypothetical protein